MLQATGTLDGELEYTEVATDFSAPFQFNIAAPTGQTGKILSFKAKAVDLDDNESAPSAASNLTLIADQPPTATIVSPQNGAVIIDGQSLEVSVETRDDLGPDGIERVVFYLNDTPVFTAFQSDQVNAGVSSGDNFYTAVIEPPLGVDGFALQAVAFDILGQSASSKVVTVGRIDDTVRPKLSVLSPLIMIF